ncbi:MAG TPA: tRNA (guanosine(37)-N1)-methyltransferase TrmD [Fimbriimonadaceae bacterium]|nr:tRNA (guanosine(37)-N1)-methyltransferase TrmD [Fimbriimonadaceae bacterium]
MPRIAFVTLFPDMIRAAVEDSIVQRAVRAGLVTFHFANPRDFTTDRHRTVDDSPYSGEPGMLMKAEPIALAVESLDCGPGALIVIPEPAAPRFVQADANELATAAEIVFICGHYEGIDKRVSEYFQAREYSIGDFVVTGGELPAAMMADAIVRKLPGALGNEDSLGADSFTNGLLSAPNYTRPEVWRDLRVPEVLLSGHHAEVAKWRKQQALKLTRKFRPELLEEGE